MFIGPNSGYSFVFRDGNGRAVIHRHDITSNTPIKNNNLNEWREIQREIELLSPVNRAHFSNAERFDYLYKHLNTELAKRLGYTVVFNDELDDLDTTYELFDASGVNVGWGWNQYDVWDKAPQWVTDVTIPLPFPHDATTQGDRLEAVITWLEQSEAGDA